MLSLIFSLGISVFILMFVTGLIISSISDKKKTQGKSVASEEHFLFAGNTLALNTLDLNVQNEAVLSPTSPTFLAKGKTAGALMDENYIPDVGEKTEAEEYTVQTGDTLKSISLKFDITIETIAWANDISSTAKLKPGQELLILPVSGVLHLVKKGDTISGIAALYKVSTQEIIEFNGLGDDGGIYYGDLLVIPGGKKPKIIQQYIKVPLSNTYFIYPVPLPCKITQGQHWFNAVDFGNGKCGDPVFAAAGGEIQKVSYGANSGNYINILHSNGAVTYYGHLSTSAVKAGDKVSQGQIIGYIGHTGNTIPTGPAGCHLHFDVRFAENPFAKLAVGSIISN